MAPPRKAAAPKAPAANRVAKPSAAPKKAAAAPKAKATKPAPAKKASAKNDNEELADAPNAEPVPAKSKKAAASATTNGESGAKKPAAASKTEAAKTNGIKRKASDDEDSVSEQVSGEELERPKKKPRTVASKAAKPAPVAKGPKPGKPINKIPTDKLDVFVFGEGSSGELGLGSKKFEGKKPIDVKRPRINHNLDAKTVGVVQIACGGMHAIALTHDNRILTWGVNDDKALGRDTTWNGGTRDIDDDSDSDDDEDSGVNPHESSPGDVDMSHFPEGTKISQVAATDSASFVVTEDGRVYGWGTFRGSDGIIGFSGETRTQPTPVRVEGLTKITRLACGSNHVLAMDKDGKVFTWGSGGQFQLGRKQFTRHGGVKAGLKPEACGKFGKRQHAVEVAAGSYHSFYLDNHGKVWAWGLNNFSQTGHSESGGQDDAMILTPQLVESLEDFKVVQLAGGEHHSVACTEEGELLTWGRVDGHQVGQPKDFFTEKNALFDDNGKPRILIKPTPLEDVDAEFVATGTDTSFALDNEGNVYSWGFSANYQTGQGTTEDIEVPTLINNTAIRDRKVIWAGAGGQFSILAAVHGDNALNGH